MHRQRPALRSGPQGEEYEALQMERRYARERERFAENVIESVDHKNLPLLGDRPAE